MRAIPVFASAVLFLLAVATLSSSVSGRSDASAGTVPAGVATIDITPDEPVRLCGYGSRSVPSEGVEQRLHAKALALGAGTEEEPLSVLVTFDGIGIPAWMSEELADRLEKKAKIDRAQLAVSATHTHAAPTLKGCLPFMFPSGLSEDETAAIDRYSAALLDRLELVALAAIASRQPARLSWGKGRLGFAANRRVLTDGKWTGFGVQPDGPVDHSMPLLRISDASGKDIAVLVNYACHCTTLGGDFNRIHADWAGEARAEIEKRHPDLIAMIAIGCGADQNPEPRGTLENAVRHGAAVADEVDRMLKETLQPIREAPSGVYNEIDLPLEPPPSKEAWEQQVEKEDRSAHFAKAMLEKLDRGETLETSVTYPIQTWAFGDDLAMVFLAGEVVVDYAHRFYGQFDADRLWINAYSNDVPCYIPTRRLYDEGGYEVDFSMVYYGKPSRLAPDTENRISDEVTKQLPHTFYSAETLALLPAPVEKEDALETIRVGDLYEVELVAAEPLVRDPVDIAWDTRGRLWVVEMADYPTGIDGKPGGRVRVLEDEDTDGTYDKSSLFLDELKYPNSVLPWRDGVLVVTADAILFARDTDGDNRADERERLFTGFDSGNSQHQLGSLQWGLDNWVHVGNGDSKGSLTSTRTGQSVELGARDLRFHPDTGEVEALSGKAQFGIARDGHGNWFGCNNSRPWWHYALDDRYLRRNPHVPYPDPKVLLTDEPVAGPVYPASRTVSRFNDYDKANRFTSACGLTVFRDTLPDHPDKASLFVAEPVHNLVSRILIEPEGATFRGYRAPEEAEAEFFASTDNWCRPTSVRTGPDGALYIVDMYRQVIEHPEWIPETWQRRLDLRAGHDRGRIYRVKEKGRELEPVVSLEFLSPRDLARELESPNGARRDLAHMEAIWRDNNFVFERLADLALTSRQRESRLQALAVLSWKGDLTKQQALGAIRDGSEGIRHAETWIARSDEEILDELVTLVHSNNAFERQQLAYSLGETGYGLAGKVLARILEQDGSDPLIRSAALSSALPHLTVLVEELEPDLSHLPKEVFTGLLRSAAGKGDQAVLARLFEIAAKASDKLLPPLVETFANSGKSLEAWKQDAGEELLPAIAALEPPFAKARETAANGEAEPSARAAAIRLLGGSPDGSETDSDLLLSLIEGSQPVEVQMAAARRSQQLGTLPLADGILERWDRLGAAVRSEAVSAFLSRASWTERFLANLAANPDRARSLDATQRAALLHHRNETIREQAGKLLAANQKSRAEVFEKYRPSLEMKSDPEDGKIHFTTLCSSCHKMGDTGFHVGPDLAALTNLSRESLLQAIVDPNLAVESKYAMYVAETSDGRTVSGVMTAETGSGITLLGPAGISETVLRTQLASLQSPGISLMPEGLEAALDPQQMANLLGYLQSAGAPPAIEPGSDGSIHLTAANGSGRGESVHLDGTTGAFSWIGSGDTVEWPLAKLPAGDYAIFFDAGSTEGASEGEKAFELTLGEKTIFGAIEETGALDRLRKRQFAEIRIDQPLENVQVRFRHHLPSGQVTVREVALIPRQ